MKRPPIPGKCDLTLTPEEAKSLTRSTPGDRS